MEIGGSQEVHGSRLTLSQLAKLKRTGFRVKGGEFEITLRDKNDPRIILVQIKKKNIITRYARIFLPTTSGWMSTGNTFLGFCEEANPASEWLSSIKSKLTTSPANPWSLISTVKSGLTWSYSASWAAPAADRTFQTIFLAYNSGSEGVGVSSSGATVWWTAQTIQAYTVLTAPRTQTTSSLLDITYRITFAE